MNILVGTELARHGALWDGIFSFAGPLLARSLRIDERANGEAKGSLEAFAFDLRFVVPMGVQTTPLPALQALCNGLGELLINGATLTERKHGWVVLQLLMPILTVHYNLVDPRVEILRERSAMLWHMWTPEVRALGECFTSEDWPGAELQMVESGKLASLAKLLYKHPLNFTVSEINYIHHRNPKALDYITKDGNFIDPHNGILFFREKRRMALAEGRSMEVQAIDETLSELLTVLMGWRCRDALGQLTTVNILEAADRTLQIRSRNLALTMHLLYPQGSPERI